MVNFCLKVGSDIHGCDFFGSLYLLKTTWILVLFIQNGEQITKNRSVVN